MIRALACAALGACGAAAHAATPPAAAAPISPPVSPPISPPIPGPIVKPGACNKSAPSGARKVSDRTYALVTPKAAGNAPLVFVLHGDGGSGAQAKSAFGFDAPNAIFAYPESPGGWDLNGNRDVLFFDAMLFAISNELCVDPKRVFVAGFSSGAYMANQLACRRGDKIRGVATFSGGGPFDAKGSYDASGHLQCPQKAVASFVVHGLGDKTVLPSEGQKSVDHWTFANRCNGSTKPTAPNGCVAYDACAQPVTACKIPGLGHGLSAETKAAAWSFFSTLE